MPSRFICSFAQLLLCIVAFVGVHAVHADDFQILWWQVGDADEWDDDVAMQGVSVQLVNGGGYTTAYDLGVDSARIRETSTGTYLKMLDPADLDDPTAASFTFDSSYVPTIWMADISDFASGSPEYKFVIELGNYESGTWSMLAVSEEASYTDLVQNQHIEGASGVDPQYVSAWMPTAYVVPEPTSGLLVLVGAALLALRRRRGLGRGNG